MTKFTVYIDEMRCQIVEIEAPSEQEAEDIVGKLYNEDKIDMSDAIVSDIAITEKSNS